MRSICKTRTFRGKWLLTVPFLPTALAFRSWVFPGLKTHNIALSRTPRGLPLPQLSCFHGIRIFVDKKFSQGNLANKIFGPRKFLRIRYIIINSSPYFSSLWKLHYHMIKVVHFVLFGSYIVHLDGTFIHSKCSYYSSIFLYSRRYPLCSIMLKIMLA